MLFSIKAIQSGGGYRMGENVDTIWISGFWRRIGALLIDSLILAVLGFLLSFLFKDTFVRMGIWGLLVGFAIGLSYFGVMNSKIADGQTIGKRILKIRVVNSMNETIGLGRSFIRYTILYIPFLINGVPFQTEILQSVLTYLLSFIIFGGIISIPYLYIFNTKTRQSLHDLITGTFVVNAETDEQALEPVWKPHFIVVAVMFIGAALVPIFTMQLAEKTPFAEMLSVQSAIMELQDVKYATIVSGSSTFKTAGQEASTTTYVSANISILEDKVDDEELARSLADIIMMHYPEASTKDVVQVTLTYGFDIGIYSSWRNQFHVFNPQNLMAIE